MIGDSQVPSALGWDMADGTGEWNLGSSLLLVLVAGLYWAASWLISGLPLFAFFARRHHT
jgi:hypothetical protein